MNKKFLKNVVGRMLALSLSFTILAMSTIRVNATEQTELPKESQTEVSAETEIFAAPLIVVDYYEITNEKIVPGEDFTLKMVLKNYSLNQAATGVLVDISNPVGVAPVYGTVSQVYIGDIGAGESKEVVIEYNSWTTIVGDTLDFNVTIVTDANQNYVILRVPVGVDSPFSIIGVTAPSEVEVYNLATLSIAFKVLGEERVKDVVLTAMSGDVLIGSSQIGILSPGLTKTQQLLLSFVDVGEHVIDLNFEYVDEEGQKKIIPITSAIISVVTETPDDIIEPLPDDTSNEDMKNILFLGIGGMLILVVFLAVIIVLRKNK
ncbi:MAG: hypothetical protein E7261_02310 [Lachnospiraceae bacterium]|nr:hypothetical protein [Lachnospiraceae bacterium]